jgi:predicted RNA-binding protein with PIN domain
VVVFDGGGEERAVGPLSVRFAGHADDLIERLAAEHRLTEEVCLVSSDAAIRGVSGQEVRKVSSRLFLSELEQEGHREQEQRGSGSRVRDRLDPGTREALERLRRGQ